MFTIKTIYINLLHIMNYFDNLIQLSIFKRIKIICIRKLLLEKDFVDNTITNIACTKPNKSQKCLKAVIRLQERKHNIFRISPRALVACVLNNNLDMLQKIKEVGYPLEMIIYASNYHLIKKRHLENFIRNLL